MYDRDWTEPAEGQSYRFEFSESAAPRQQERQPGHGLKALAIVLIALVGLAGLGVCLFSGMDLHFNRFDGGFTLSLQDEPNTDTLAADADELPDPGGLTAQSDLSATPIQNSEVTPPPQNVTVQPAGEALSFREIYAMVNPSVVSIRASEGYSASTGSGFIISADGYIATNAHVVNGLEQLSVTLYDGSVFPAEVVGADTISDLAVLKIACEGLVPVEFGDSEELFVGDTVVAIGDPLGIELRGTMTDGIISAINRDLQVDGRTMTLLQTNAALNEGNSGGPLINLQGQVIGINTIKLSSSYASIEGLGFAIPSSQALPILNELMSQGYISGRPDFGFTGITVPTYAQFYYRLPGGVYIESVKEGSDAEEKGLLPGDVVTRVDGETISNLSELEQVKNSHSAGDEVELIIYRRGTYYSVQIVLGENTPES